MRKGIKDEKHSDTGSDAKSPHPHISEPNLSPAQKFPIREREPSGEVGLIPARMLNEFVYCPRLFYYEHVEGVFVESADTLRGAAVHKRVDAGSGALQPPETAAGPSADTSTSAARPEIIHSRSVTLGSNRLGVIAKLDLVEVQVPPPAGDQGDLFAAPDVVPVDYKAGAPKEEQSANDLWPTDKMQLGLQILILRDNGYCCREGVIYYRATRQRVRLEMTADLEQWILSQIELARQTVNGPIPPPLVASPKCRRCSLVPVCLPDETRLLATPPVDAPAAMGIDDRDATGSGSTPGSSLAVAASPPIEPPRRLIAARDDTRTLFLNTPGFRVGRKDGILTIKDENETVDEVRLADLHHVALFGNIQITTQAVQTLCDAEIPITYFSGGGWFYGMTRGHGLKNVFLRIEQFRLAGDSGLCLRLANSLLTHPVFDYKVSYRRALELQARILSKCLTGEIPEYIPLMTR